MEEIGTAHDWLQHWRKKISVRALNVLYRLNIRSLADLRATTDEEILNVRNIGRTTLRELRRIERDLTGDIDPAAIRDRDERLSGESRVLMLELWERLGLRLSKPEADEMFAIIRRCLETAVGVELLADDGDA